MLRTDLDSLASASSYLPSLPSSRLSYAKTSSINVGAMSDSIHSISKQNLMLTGVTVSVEIEVVAESCFARWSISLEHRSYSRRNVRFDVASASVRRGWSMVDVNYFALLAEVEDAEGIGDGDGEGLVMLTLMVSEGRWRRVAVVITLGFGR